MTEVEEFRKVFVYYPDTGLLYRNDRKRFVGTPRDSGHMQVSFKNKLQYVHRVIWLIVTGEWPKREIDHIDGDPTNNKWENLREATPTQNMANRSGWGRHKYKGYVHHRITNSYHVRVGVEGKILSFGYYKTELEAALVYNREAERLFGEYAKLNVIEELIE